MTCIFETYVDLYAWSDPPIQTNKPHSIFVGADLHGEARIVNHSSGARVQPGNKGLQVGEAQSEKSIFNHLGCQKKTRNGFFGVSCLNTLPDLPLF